jgi:hypothetical protein
MQLISSKLLKISLSVFNKHYCKLNQEQREEVVRIYYDWY